MEMFVFLQNNDFIIKINDFKLCFMNHEAQFFSISICRCDISASSFHRHTDACNIA